MHRTISGHLPGARITAMAVAGVLTAGSLTACSHPAPLAGSCGIVVDASKSGNATTGFDALKELQLHLNGFLTSVGCRYAVFGPINGDSLASRCTEPQLDMDPPDPAADPTTIVTAGRAAALASAKAELRCARTDSQSDTGASDITGGLLRIMNERPHEPGPYSVLVVSDFVSFDSLLRIPDVNLTTQAMRAAIIGKLATEGQVPNLTGVNVYTAGFGLNFGRNAERAQEFREFWQEYMTRAHAASFQLEQS
jgi:hypothetical protein